MANNEDPVEKALRQGKLFRWSQNKPLTRQQAEAWFYMIHSADGASQSISEGHMFLFLRSDHECKLGTSAPEQGIPSTAAHIMFLFDADKSTGPRIVEDDLTNANIEEAHRMTKNDVTKLLTVTSDNIANLNDVLDKFVYIISGGMYGLWTDYVVAAPTIRKAIRELRTAIATYADADIATCFANRKYKTFKELKRACLRMCKIQDDKLSTKNLFSQLDKIVEGSANLETKHMKFTIALEELFILEKGNFITCKEFPGQEYVQTLREQYNPIIGTLLAYILTREGRKNNPGGWDNVERLFAASCMADKSCGEYSYQQWCKKRDKWWQIVEGQMSSSHHRRVHEVDFEENGDVYAAGGSGQKRKPFQRYSSSNPPPKGSKLYNNCRKCVEEFGIHHKHHKQSDTINWWTMEAHEKFAKTQRAKSSSKKNKKRYSRRVNEVAEADDSDDNNNINQVDLRRLIKEEINAAIANQDDADAEANQVNGEDWNASQDIYGAGGI